MNLVCNDDEFKEYDYNKHNEHFKVQIANCNESIMPPVTMRDILCWDAAGINGNCESESRTTGTNKLVGFGTGLDGAPFVYHRIFQFFSGDEDYRMKKVVTKEYLNVIFSRIHGKRIMIELTGTGKTLPADMVVGATFDLKTGKIFKGNSGAGGNISQTDVVYNKNGKIVYMERKKEHWTNLQIPFADEIKDNQPEKFRDFIVNIPQHQEQVQEHINYLDNNGCKLPFPDLKPTHPKN
eukprot:2039_1